MRLTLTAARGVLGAHATVGALHRRGYGWVRDRFLPAARRLEGARAKADRRRAARAFRLLGDVHDLNGAPRAAIRAYQRALKLDPQQAAPWHAIGCMLDNMGEFARARHALLRAQKLAPKDELLAGDLERVDWAMFNPCPVLFESENRIWEAAEELAAGRPNRALARLKRRRSILAQQARAQIHAARGEARAALAEWTAIAAASGRIQLRHADWYYTLQGATADQPALWRLLLWKVRTRLDGGVQRLPPSLDELDVREPKRFELFVRFQLARTEGDLAALLALAAKYPTWREPGEAALRLT